MARILLVDDEPLFRKATMRVLVRMGHEVFPAASGAEGRALWEAERPDLAIVDWHMPGEDGLETIRGIQALQPDARVALTTASTPPAEAADIPVIAKPWGPAGFQAIAALLDG